jgi:hypothetical protein
MNRSSHRDGDIFHVSGSMDFFSRLIYENPRIWRGLGNLETKILGDQLRAIEIDRPVYISGLARSGSTILLEIMAKLPGIVTHRYKDFPPLYTPYWWNWLLNRMLKHSGSPTERAHRDGIMVTADSPEAMEEPIWMSFFSGLHEPGQSNVLNNQTVNQDFEQFYRNHIRKLLLTRGGDRYVSKGNYQVTRLEYLLKIFPDARIVIPVRQPVAHIASLMKQHDLFNRGQKVNARARMHLRRVGHFEFGLDRQPINTGNIECTNDVRRAWKRAEEIRGWAVYWSQIYGYLADLLEQNEYVRDASCLVRFEDLCDKPKRSLRSVFEHCGFPTNDHFVNAAAGQVHKPNYYAPDFSDEEMALINFETHEAASRLCY